MTTIRTLTALEIELIAIVKMQSEKLVEASEYIAHIGGCTEAINDAKNSADITIYLEQYGIDPRQLSLVDLRLMMHKATN